MKKLAAIKVVLVGVKALPISDSEPVDLCCYRPGTLYNGKWSTTASGISDLDCTSAHGPRQPVY